MIECGVGYCLEPVNFACVKIIGGFYGKEQKTHFCLVDSSKGVQFISECQSGYCKIIN